MTSQEILQQLQALFAIEPADMQRMFSAGGIAVTDQQIDQLCGENSGAGQLEWCTDDHAIRFLNGFIIEVRGPGDKGAPPVEEVLTNNLIFRKVKIALNLHADDIVLMLADVDTKLSKHELSALFRKAGHKHHRECSDELLAAFIEAVKNNHYTE